VWKYIKQLVREEKSHIWTEDLWYNTPSAAVKPNNNEAKVYILLHMRFVQKISRLTTVHEVNKAYRVLTLTVFNIVPFRSYTLCLTFLSLLETFYELLFGMSNSIFAEFRLMSSDASNRCPYKLS